MAVLSTSLFSKTFSVFDLAVRIFSSALFFLYSRLLLFGEGARTVIVNNTMYGSSPGVPSPPRPDTHTPDFCFSGRWPRTVIVKQYNVRSSPGVPLLPAPTPTLPTYAFQGGGLEQSL
ncbi:hypothetical protein CEXT_465021 [Caerostris extrusa]|uniref:Uncharacterized protein n=1 Tax=Caerostris extrusa TaxID=172846 RepID=A0AAV4XK86_CAEEX|nr:hypothetical protein CEXT_465021 [Caerostris extrusa]